MTKKKKKTPDVSRGREREGNLSFKQIGEGGGKRGKKRGGNRKEGEEPRSIIKNRKDGGGGVPRKRGRPLSSLGKKGEETRGLKGGTDP